MKLVALWKNLIVSPIGEKSGIFDDRTEFRHTLVRT